MNLVVGSGEARSPSRTRASVSTAPEQAWKVRTRELKGSKEGPVDNVTRRGQVRWAMRALPPLLRSTEQGKPRKLTTPHPHHGKSPCSAPCHRQGNGVQRDAICPVMWTRGLKPRCHQPRSASPRPVLCPPGTPFPGTSIFPFGTWFPIHHEASRASVIGIKVPRSDLQ